MLRLPIKPSPASQLALLCSALTAFIYYSAAATSEKNEDGKSYVNPATERLSKAYEAFTEPIANGRRGGELLFFAVLSCVEICCACANNDSCSYLVDGCSAVVS